MAYISNNKFWESEFDIIFSQKDKTQVININQLNSMHMIVMRKMKNNNKL